MEGGGRGEVESTGEVEGEVCRGAEGVRGGRGSEVIRSDEVCQRNKLKLTPDSSLAGWLVVLAVGWWLWSAY